MPNLGMAATIARARARGSVGNLTSECDAMAKLSAGLLPYRVADDGSLTVLLVHPGGPFWRNKEEHAWSIPKGEYPAEEDPREAAAREFTEELGFPVPEGPWIDLGTIRQSGGKYVRAWAVQADDLTLEGMVSNRFEMEWPPKSGTMKDFPEVDRAQWMTIPEATTRLVASQVEFLARLSASLEARSD
jgi:predicted NUDIX family NTP pyrophosphohydrolase